MCYTKYASLRSFVIGSLTSLALYKYTNDPSLKAISMFILFVSLMQLADYIFWTVPTKNTTNYIVTKTAMLLNHLQPFVLFLVIYFYVNKNITNSRNSKKYILILGLLYSIAYSIYSWMNIDYTLPVDDVLYWQWNNLPTAKYFYAAFLMAFVLFGTYFRYPHNIAFIFFAVSSFIFSFYKYKHNSNVGRFWCHYTGYTPLLFLLIDTLSL